MFDSVVNTPPTLTAIFRKVLNVIMLHLILLCHTVLRLIVGGSNKIQRGGNGGGEFLGHSFIIIK